MVVEKAEVIDTWNLYDAAPDEAFQLKAGVKDIPVAPLEGAARTGVTGTGGAVRKDQFNDQMLAPAGFDAFTCQYMVVLFGRPEKAAWVVLNPAWSKTTVAKFDVREACSR